MLIKIYLVLSCIEYAVMLHTMYTGISANCPVDDLPSEKDVKICAYESVAQSIQSWACTRWNGVGVDLYMICSTNYCRWRVELL